MILTEFEKKRAANMIWNAAGNYNVSIGFRMYDNEARADLYWNTILGSSYAHFDWKRLKEFYNTFHETIGQGTYETLFWIALENATFEKEKNLRPSLLLLRKEYCRQKLKEFMPSIAESREGWILEGHYRISIGEDSGLPDMVDRKLLSEVEIGADVDTEGFIKSLSGTLAKYFTYLPGVSARFQKHRFKVPIPRLFFGKKAGVSNEVSGATKLVLGYVENQGGADASAFETDSEKFNRVTEEGLRKYISSYFGKSIYDDKTSEKIQRECCVGNHIGTRIFFTRGESEEKVTGFAAKMRTEMKKQYKKNEEFFFDNIGSNNAAILELTNRIKNALLTQLEPAAVYSKTGKLNPALVWKALYLNNNKIFEKQVAEGSGNISVDILLDASASQIHRMDTVSTQGYIIAKALDNCHVPVRVWGYSSMNGYTVMNLYRDYNETSKNNEIFRFFTTGANRDGLALNALIEQMKKNTASHRVVIWLTDIKPNDMLEVKGKSRNYSGDIAVEDMTELVHKAKLENIYVLCAFTGDNADLPNVQKIFGRSFVKVKSLDNFASLVGNMLQAEIRRM